MILPDKTRYAEIADDIIEQIYQGVYPPGSSLPSENELADLYGVHRLTIRHAFQILQERGILDRSPGQGNLVRKNKLPYALKEQMGFSDNLSRLGYTSYRKLLGNEVIFASRIIANLLNISVQDRILQLTFLRAGSPKKDDQRKDNILPICLSKTYIISEKFPNLSNLIEQGNSLYNLLKTHYQIVPRCQKTLVETDLALKEDVQFLKVDPGQPMLITKSFVADQNDQLFEYTESRFRGDFVSFDI